MVPFRLRRTSAGSGLRGQHTLRGVEQSVLQPQLLDPFDEELLDDGGLDWDSPVAVVSEDPAAQCCPAAYLDDDQLPDDGDDPAPVSILDVDRVHWLSLDEDEQPDAGADDLAPAQPVAEDVPQPPQFEDEQPDEDEDPALVRLVEAAGVYVIDFLLQVALDEDDLLDDEDAFLQALTPDDSIQAPLQDDDDELVEEHEPVLAQIFDAAVAVALDLLAVPQDDDLPLDDDEADQPQFAGADSQVLAPLIDYDEPLDEEDDPALVQLVEAAGVYVINFLLYVPQDDDEALEDDPVDVPAPVLGNEVFVSIPDEDDALDDDVAASVSPAPVGEVFAPVLEHDDTLDDDEDPFIQRLIEAVGVYVIDFLLQTVQDEDELPEDEDPVAGLIFAEDLVFAPVDPDDADLDEDQDAQIQSIFDAPASTTVDVLPVYPEDEEPLSDDEPDFISLVLDAVAPYVVVDVYPLFPDYDEVSEDDDEELHPSGLFEDSPISGSTGAGVKRPIYFPGDWRRRLLDAENQERIKLLLAAIEADEDDE